MEDEGTIGSFCTGFIGGNSRVVGMATEGGRTGVDRGGCMMEVVVIGDMVGGATEITVGGVILGGTEDNENTGGTWEGPATDKGAC